MPARALPTPPVTVGASSDVIVDGERDWRTIVDALAAERACTPVEASEALEPSLLRLTKEAFILWSE